MRLPGKILLVVVAIIVVVGGGASVAVVRMQRAAGLRQVEMAAQTLASTIYHGLESSMIRNNPDEMQEIIRHLRNEPMVRRVDIFRADGRVWSTSDGPGPPGPPSVEVAAVLEQAQPQVRERPGTGELVALTPILNKPACYACHTDRPRLLGAVAVSLDTSRLDRQIAANAALLAAFMALAVLVALGILGYVVARVLLRPIHLLEAGARSLAGGDYSARVLWPSPDELGVLASTFNDMAERVQRYTAGLTREIAELTRRLTGLGLFGRTLAEATDVDRALAEVVEAAGRQVRADACALYLVDGGGEAPVQVWGARGALGSPTAGDDGERSSLHVPLVTRDRRLGTLVVVRRGRPPFGAEDRALLEALAHPLAISLENRRLFEEVKEKEQLRGHLLERVLSAQEDERRRLARELHDEVSQSLTGLMLRIDLAMAAIPPDGDAPAARGLREALGNLRALAESTLDEVHRIVYDLRPSPLDDLDLVSAVRWYVRTHLEPAGIQAVVTAHGYDDQQRLPLAVETALFRVLQEALTNVLRHARAQRVEVSVAVDRPARRVQVAVTDDGTGFDVAAAWRQRERPPLGLAGMQERMELLGGHLKVRSEPGHGTQVVGEAPLPPVSPGGQTPPPAPPRPRA